MKTLIGIIVIILMTLSNVYACPTGTAKTNVIAEGKEVCSLTGRYISDLVLTNGYSYQLKGGVFIGNDNKDNSNLTIQAGTKIYGATGADFLVITRGSKILAQGTESSPIVFTAKSDNQQRGSWGGIIINGNAPINCKSQSLRFCEAEGEGSTGIYGGSDAIDNSGVLKYVRVEYAGYEITPENELNGIAFQGVGAGTLVDYVQVHMNADDGIEFFGGTVNVRHIVLTANKDDSLDWTSGWRGKAQYVLIKQATDEGNNGIEADNLKSPMNADPRSNPTLLNVTMIGSQTAKKGGAGILLRRGTGVKIYNSVITGFKKGGLDVDDIETFRNGHAYSDSDNLPGVHITNSVFDNNVNFITDEGEEDLSLWILKGMDLDILFGLEAARVEPIVMSDNTVEVEMEAVLPEDEEGFFDEVDFIGAVSPYEKDWSLGWTIQ